MWQIQTDVHKGGGKQNAFQTFALEGRYYFAMWSLAFVPEPHKGMTIVSVSQCR